MISTIRSVVNQTIYQSIPEFPKVISDLVGDYLSYEHLDETIRSSIYAREIETTGIMWPTKKRIRKFVIEDPAVTSAIKYCLRSPDCDPKVKSSIIAQFVSNRQDRCSTNHKPQWSSGTYHFNNSTEICPVVGILGEILDDIRKSGFRINLDYTNLSGLDLGHLNLENMSAVGAIFRQTNLHAANLAFADLTNANFSHAQLIQSTLNHVTACGANFEVVDMSAAQMKCADFTQANLSHAILNDADLYSAKLCRALLNHAFLSNSNLRKVDFRGAHFHRTYLSLDNSHHTDLTGAITGDASMSKFLDQFKTRSKEKIIVSGTVYLSSVVKKKEIKSCRP